jgi:type 1 fimbria pilin
MGFQMTTVYTSTSKSLVMPYTCNFNGIQSINIHFDNVNTSNIDSFTETTSSIIQSIPIDYSSQQITFNKTSRFAFNIVQDTIDFIDIKLMDDLQNLINLNNQHWNLTLYFSKVKDYDRFHYTKDFNSILNYGTELFN